MTWPFVWYCVRLCCYCVKHLTISVLALLVCCYCVCTSRSQSHSLLLAPVSTCCGHSAVFWRYSAYCDDLLHLSRLLGSCSQAVMLYIVMVPPQYSERSGGGGSWDSGGFVPVRLWSYCLAVCRPDLARTTCLLTCTGLWLKCLNLQGLAHPWR